MKKNERYIGEVERLGFNGEGILFNDGITVFIPFALPKEKVEYLVLKVDKKIAYAKLIEVITPSISRLKPDCAVFTKCGGCQLQHLKYKEQLLLKAKTVADCLSKIAFISADVLPCKSGGKEYGYRNKLQLPVREENGEVKIGFFAPNSHRIVEISDCPIQPEWCKDIISVIKEFLYISGVKAYSEISKSGSVKHVVVREVDKKLMITVVIAEKRLEKTEILIDLLKKKFSDFSLFVNINRQGNNVIFGDRFINVFGKSKILANELGVRYEMTPESFMQINDSVRGELYKTAFEFSAADKDTTVIDAYSGAGLLTALFAERCKKAIGIEIVKEAVDCANALKEMNGISNMENICAPCEEVLPKIIGDLSGEKTVLVLDPPRRGVDIKVIEAIKKSLPERIVYISCSPQTLARDIGLIMGTLEIKNGVTVKAENPEKSTYRLTFVQPFDLFPQTKHVETVVLLNRVAV